MLSIRFLSRLALIGVVGLALGYVAAFWTGQGWQTRAIEAHADALYRSPTSPVAGNPNGDVTVVAFLDYNCPYCRQGAPALQKLVEQDGKVRLVIKQLPVLGAQSVDAAKLALAAASQGKYLALHERLMSEPGRATKETTLAAARALGLDTAKLEQDAADPETAEAIAANRTLAGELDVRGVPFYLVGDRVVPEGERLYERFAAALDDVRKNGCSAKC